MDHRELRWLRMANDLTDRLAQAQSPTSLYEAILDASIALTSAERGYLVLVVGRRADGGVRFRVETARGFAGESLKPTRRSVPRSLVEQVVSGPSFEPLLAKAGSLDLRKTSVEERQIKSAVCVPIALRGEILGALYLDHRFDGEVFAEEDLPGLAAFALRAALALERLRLEAQEPTPSPRPLARPAVESFGPLPAPGSVRTFGALVGSSALATLLFQEIERCARSRLPALVVGEPGTGRTSVAREIWKRRGSGPSLHVVHPGGSLEAPPDADLLLESVEELDPRAQLEVLQRLSVQGAPWVVATASPRLLTDDPRPVLPELFLRLDVFRITIPPLRRRLEDLPALLAVFLGKAGGSQRLSPAAAKVLLRYEWPGNLRELESVCMYLATLPCKELAASDLPAHLREGASPLTPTLDTRGLTMDQLEKTALVQAMEACQGNKAEAARKLGIARSSLYRLLQKHEVEA